MDKQTRPYTSSGLANCPFTLSVRVVYLLSPLSMEITPQFVSPHGIFHHFFGIFFVLMTSSRNILYGHIEHNKRAECNTPLISFWLQLRLSLLLSHLVLPIPNFVLFIVYPNRNTHHYQDSGVGRTALSSSRSTRISGVEFRIASVNAEMFTGTTADPCVNIGYKDYTSRPRQISHKKQITSHVGIPASACIENSFYRTRSHMIALFQLTSVMSSTSRS